MTVNEEKACLPQDTHVFVKENALDSSMIKLLLNSDVHFKKAEVVVDNKSTVTISNNRRCREARLSVDKHLDVFEQVHALFDEANQSFNKEYSRDRTTVSIMRYTEQDLGHFDWHIDAVNYSSINYVRQLSMSILLDNNYEGGKLCFENRVFDRPSPGTCIIFPSTYRHKVEMVTRGVRHSLVSWAY
jgi:predicted 2-oxoglutarate/Fe(II)-dependent dioxygenase YbiX